MREVLELFGVDVDGLASSLMGKFSGAISYVADLFEKLKTQLGFVKHEMGDADASLKRYQQSIADRANLGIVDALKDEDAITKQLNEQLKTNTQAQDKATEAAKRANDAADTLNKTQDAQLEKLRSMGVMTQEVAATGLAPLIDKLNLAAAAGDKAQDGGQRLRLALITLEPELQDIGAAMRNSGMDTRFLTEMMDQLQVRAGSLPGVLKVNFDNIGNIVQESFGDSTEVVRKAFEDYPKLAAVSLPKVAQVFEGTLLPRVRSVFGDLQRSFIDTLLGMRSQSAVEHKRLADDAIENYERIRADGTKTPEEIRQAFVAMQDAIKAASSPFKDTIVDIFKDMGRGIKQVFSDILNDFTGRLLKGMLGAMSGQQGAWSKAFSGLLNLGGAAGMGGGAALTNAAGVGSSTWMAAAGVPGSAAPPAGAGMAGTVGSIAGGAAVGGLVGWGVGSQTGNKWGAGAAGAASGAAAGAALGAAFAPATLGLSVAIGALAGLLGGWVGAKRANVRANNDRDAFIGQFGGQGTGEGSGFHTLAAKLTEAGAGAGGGKLFSDLINANDPKEFAQAMEKVNAALDAYKAKTDAAAEAEGQLATKIDETKKQSAERMAALQTQMDGLNDEIKKWDELEAPEEVMGVVEKAAREKIAQQKTAVEAAMQAQQQAAEAAIAELTRAAAEAAAANAATVTTQGEAAGRGISDGFSAGYDQVDARTDQTRKYMDDRLSGLAYDVRINFIGGELPGIPGGPAVPQFDHGSGGIRDFGRGTLAMLHGREEVRTEAQARAASAGAGVAIDYGAIAAATAAGVLSALEASGITSALSAGGSRALRQSITAMVGSMVDQNDASGIFLATATRKALGVARA